MAGVNPASPQWQFSNLPHALPQNSETWSNCQYDTNSEAASGRRQADRSSRTPDLEPLTPSGGLSLPRVYWLYC